MLRTEKNCFILAIGLFLINLVFFSILITTLLFVINVSISWLNIILALICSSVSCVILLDMRSKKASILIPILTGLFILASIIVVCSVSYDPSWDGNTYHKIITGSLNWGWNPIHETYDEFRMYSFLRECPSNWVQPYPKGAEIWAACIYSVVGNIEAGKSFNLVSMAAVFCISYALLCETKRLKPWQTGLCAVFCVLNPVTIVQSLTYYNDGFLGCMLLLCLEALCYITFFEKGRYSKLCFWLVFVSINIGFNLKFSAVAFFAILCISFFLYWIVLYSKRGFISNKKTIINHFIFFVFTVFFGIGITGMTSYIKNIIYYHNPLYPLVGEGSIDIINGGGGLPLAAAGKSNISQFIGSLFSKSIISPTLDHYEWKIPFTFDVNEFLEMMVPDTRTGGWGPLFSGILLMSLGIVLFCVIVDKSFSQRFKQVTGILFAALIVGVIFIPGLSWARYSPFLFWIPVGAMIYLFLYMNHRRTPSQIPHLIAGMLAALLCVNLLSSIMINMKRLIVDYRSTCQQLENFREVTESRDVVVGFVGNENFAGKVFTLYDMGITNFEFGTVDPETALWLFSTSSPIGYEIIEE